jgi:hypothetical protein
VPAWVAAVLGTLVAVGFVTAAIRIWNNNNALADRGLRTTAVVVGAHEGRDLRSTVVFRTTDGREVRSRIGQGDEGPDLKVGDEIQVVYDPQDPTADVNDVRASSNHVFAFLALGIAVVCAAFTVHSTRKAARLANTVSLDSVA